MNNLSSYFGKRPIHAILFFIVLFAGVFGLARLNAVGNSPSFWSTQRFECNNTLMTETQIASYRGISVETLHLLHTRRSLSNEDICIMPEDKLARAVDKATHPKPDHPDDALVFRLLQLRDENGFIPADGLSKAAEQIQLMKGDGSNLDRAGISPGDWTWLGPGNIGGRIRSIVIHPTNPNQMWVGSVSGGIWTTTDGGSSWQPVNDFMANLAVSALIMQPGNPSIMYAGTGEGFYNFDGIQGAGVFKSTNGGVAWAQLASTTDSNWYYVNRLAISPNGSVVLAATGTGIWRSTNGGSSWTQTLADWRVKDINFHPTNNNNAIASGSEGTAWYSVNGGATWNPAGGLPTLDFLGRVEVAYAPSNPTKVYASVGQNSGQIWRSTDGGQTYSLISTGYNYLGAQGWYDNIIWVDPTNENNLIVGGIDLWRSTNGGTSLTQISQWWNAPNSAHADHHTIVEHPSFNGSTNRTVYFGNDGGIYRANNVYTVVGTTGWQELNNNLGITQFYGAAGNPSSAVIVGGTQDNGTLRYSGNTETWTAMFGGDGGFDAADPTNPNYFYGEYVYLQIHRSTDGGISSNYIFSGLGDAGSCANFIAPFILDPNNANTLLAGGCSLWRSTNVKASTPTWTSIKSPAGDSISAIAVAPGNSSIIWVGYNNGEVYKTSNGTAASPTWVRVDNNSPPLPNRYVTRLTIDRNNHNLVYATFGGFSTDNIWRTTNAGTSWSDRTGSGATGLPDAPVRSLVIHPDNSNWIYAGTEVGIFASEDGGGTWSLPQDGPANVSVDELFWMNSNLIAATHGRGLFQAAVTTGGQFTLAVGKTGTGTGTVTSNPSGINCGSDCFQNYDPGTVVTLTASADPDSTFTGWSGGGCSSTGTCTVTMNASTSVTADFTADSLPLPDLIIESITPVPANPQINQPVTFSVVIKNQGQADASAFWVDLFIDTAFPLECSGAGQVFQNIGSLAAGASQTLNLEYSGFPAAGVHTVNGTVDTNCNVEESNEGNNTKTINLTIVKKRLTTRSIGTQDGWVIESTETSNQGGTANTAATLLAVGDNAQDKQYRSFLSFNTFSLPDNAVITKIQLKIRHNGFAGTNMFTPTKTHGNLVVDIRKPYFGTNLSLLAADFQAAASKNAVGVLASAPTPGWYTITLNATSFPFVNLTGTTQFRLRFQSDDNDDLQADFLKIFSGDATSANRPILIVEYDVP